MDDETPIWEQYQRGPLLGPLPGREPVRQQPTTTAGPSPARAPSIYEQRTQAAPDEGLDYADIGKGAVGGFGRGTTGLAGLLGDAKQAMAAGGEWIGNKLGLPPLPEDVKRNNAMAAFNPPTSADIRRAVEPYTGEFYEPTTKAGKYASTLGEFAPAAFVPGAGASRFLSPSAIPGLRVAGNTLGQVIGSRAVNTVAPALASEALGQLTEGSPYEKYARLTGGLTGGLAATRAITPGPLANVSVPSWLARTAGATIGSHVGGWPGAAIGAVVAPSVSRTIGRSGYVNNQILPTSNRDAITQALLQQGLSASDAEP